MFDYDTWTIIIKYLDDPDLNNLLSMSRFFRDLIRNECAICEMCGRSVFEEIYDSLMLCNGCLITYSQSYSVDIRRDGASDGKIGFSLRYRGNIIDVFRGKLVYNGWYDDHGYYPDQEEIDLRYDLQNCYGNFVKNLKAIEDDDLCDIEIYTELAMENGRGNWTIVSRNRMIEFYNEDEMILEVSFGRIKYALIDIFEHLLNVCVHYHHLMFSSNYRPLEYIE